MSYFFGAALFICKHLTPRTQEESSKRRQFLCLQLQLFSGSTLTPEHFLWAFSQSCYKWCCAYRLLADFPEAVHGVSLTYHTDRHSLLPISIATHFNRSLKWKTAGTHFIFPITVSARLMVIFKTQHCVGDTQINDHCFVIAVTAMIWHRSSWILLGDHFRGKRPLPYALPSLCSPLFSRMTPIHSVVPTSSLLLAEVWALRLHGELGQDWGVISAPQHWRRQDPPWQRQHCQEILNASVAGSESEAEDSGTQFCLG